MKPTIVIEEIKKPHTSGGPNKAFVWLTLHNVSVSVHCRVVQTKEGDMFLALPQREWTGKDGKKNYVREVRLDRAVLDEAMDLVAREFDPITDDDIPF